MNKIQEKKKTLAQLKLKNIKLQFLFVFFKQFEKNFNVNSISLNIKILNKFRFLSFFKYLKKKFRSFLNSLFTRRYALYIDFIRLTSLYQKSRINLSSYLYVIGEIFHRLLKKKHSKFLDFIKKFFKFVILQYKKSTKIIGIKFKITGKIKGKLRARSTTIKIGSVPISTESKDVNFSHISVYTMYGVFGLKFWSYTY